MAVRALKRRSDRAHTREIEDADDAIFPSIVNDGTSGTTGNLYGAADSQTTTVNLGTAPTVTAVNIGTAGSTATMAGNLTVNGTTTTLNTENLTVEDKLILLNANAVVEPADSMGVALERGSSGDDAVMIYQTTDGRFELGFAETSGGTVAPVRVASFRNLGINSLIMDNAGSGVTIDSSNATDGVNLSDDALSLIAGGALSLGNSTETTSINAGSATFTGTIAIGNAGSGAVTVDTGAGVSIDAVTASNFTTSGGALTLSATGGDTVLTSTDGNVDIDAGTGAGDNVSIDGLTANFGTAATTTTINVGNAAGASATNIDAGTGNLNLDSQGTTADAITITAEGAGGGVNIDAATGGILDLDGGTVNLGDVNATDINIGVNAATGTTINIGNSAIGAVTVDSGTAISLDSGGASNFTTSSGALTLSATGAGAGDDVIISAGASGDITFAALGSATTAFNETGDLVLQSLFTAAGVTSIIGALNAIARGDIIDSNTTLQEAYVNGNTITTSSSEGIVTIQGNQSLDVTADGGLNVGNSNVLSITDSALTNESLIQASHDINVQAGSAAGGSGGAGSAATVAAGDGDGAGAGGDLTLNAGDSGTGTAGDVIIDAGSSATDGDIAIGTNNVNTVSVGSAGAGAVTVDTGAGISLDAVTASNFTTSGGALTLSATGGDTVLTSTDGNVDIDAGTGAGDNVSIDGLTANFGTAATTTTINVGNAAGASATNIDAGTGNLNLDSQGTTADAITITAEGAGGGVNIDAATGGILDLDGGTVNLGDVNATDINIGVNAATGTTINIGNSAIGAVTVDSGTGISLDAGGASNFTTSSGALTISTTGAGAGDDISISAGASADISFSALGSASTEFNQVGDLILNSNFSGVGISSIIGALNAIQDGRVPLSASVSSANTIRNTYTAGEAISAGEAVRIPIGTADTVRLTDADVEAESNFIGLAEADIAASATGSIVTEGVTNAILVAGLTIGTGTGEVAAGQEVFLSLTAGSLTTDVSSFTAGDTVFSIGYIKDELTYNGSSDLTVEVQLRVGERTVLS